MNEMNHSLGEAPAPCHGHVGGDATALGLPPLRWVDETGSTNADLLAWCRMQSRLQVPSRAVRSERHASGIVQVLAARRQTAGRGRLGRVWHTQGEGSGSVPDEVEALTFSLAWLTRRPLAQLGPVSLACGVGVAQALESLGLQPRLKWPNDVLVNEAKVAGILIESAGPLTLDGETQTWLVIGIGINRALAPATRQAIAEAALQRQAGPQAGAPALPVTDLHAQGVAASVEVLLAQHVLPALCHVLEGFEREGFSALRDAWNQRHRYAGCQVQVFAGGAAMPASDAADAGATPAGASSPRRAMVLGADEDGALCLAYRSAAGGEPIVERVFAGEVSLRVID